MYINDKFICINSNLAYLKVMWDMQFNNSIKGTLQDFFYNFQQHETQCKPNNLCVHQQT